MTIKIEEGKYYWTRDGRKAGPMQIDLSRDWPAFCGSGDYNHEWQLNGTWSSRPDDPASLDIVAEWPDELVEEQIQQAAVDLHESTNQALYGDQQKAEPGWKMDAGKPRIDLVAPEFVQQTADVLAFGAAKYSERNWEKGMSWGRCFGAMMRHKRAWWAGERNDPESGLPHLAHAACCLMFLVAYEARQVGTDDRKLTVDKPVG